MVDLDGGSLATRNKSEAGKTSVDEDSGEGLVAMASLARSPTGMAWQAVVTTFHSRLEKRFSSTPITNFFKGIIRVFIEKGGLKRRIELCYHHLWITSVRGGGGGFSSRLYMHDHPFTQFFYPFLLYMGRMPRRVVDEILNTPAFNYMQKIKPCII